MFLEPWSMKRYGLLFKLLPTKEQPKVCVLRDERLLSLEFNFLTFTHCDILNRALIAHKVDSVEIFCQKSILLQLKL